MLWIKKKSADNGKSPEEAMGAFLQNRSPKSMRSGIHFWVHQKNRKGTVGEMDKSTQDSTEIIKMKEMSPKCEKNIP